jgi:hypothetical protein
VLILYSVAKISREIKSRRMRWQEHVARMGEPRKHTKLQSENLKIRDNLRNLKVDGKIILKWIIKQGVSMWTEFIWLSGGVL